MSYAARVVVAALVGLMLTLPAAAQNEVTERFAKTAHLDQNGTFDLTNVTGDIVITGTTGRDVTIDATVDSNILGGIVVKLGSQRIDASIRTKLNRLAEAMKG